MTFTEYCNQPDPKFLNYFTVKVTPADCNRIDKYVILKMFGDYYSYILDPISRGLFTVDEQGNKKSPSVFFLESNENT